MVLPLEFFEMTFFWLVLAGGLAALFFSVKDKVQRKHKFVFKDLLTILSEVTIFTIRWSIHVIFMFALLVFVKFVLHVFKQIGNQIEGLDDQNAFRIDFVKLYMS